MVKPIYSLAQIKDRIDSGANWNGNISYAIPDTAPGIGRENAGFVPLSAHMKAMAATAFEMWDDLIAPSMTQVASGGNITFAYSGTTGGGTYTSTSYAPGTGGRDKLVDADIWLDKTWSSHDQDSDIRPGSYGFMTYLHEIGHALGLDHPGNYNGSATYAADALYAQDTRRWSVMSYFDAEDAGDGTNHKSSYGATPLLHDIATIQSIYGADKTTRTGNTTYGFGSTAERDAFNFSVNKAPVVAIWDAGGRDTVNLSGYAMAQTIDLAAGHTSSVGGLTNNLAIAFGAWIENAIGGKGIDTITGNAARNILRGGAGNDILSGLAGNDALRGGAGRDRLDGGAGTDTAYFDGKHSAYHIVDKADGSVVITGGADGGDTLIGIERVVFSDETILL